MVKNVIEFWRAHLICFKNQIASRIAPIPANLFSLSRRTEDLIENGLKIAGGIDLPYSVIRWCALPS